MQKEKDYFLKKKKLSNQYNIWKKKLIKEFLISIIIPAQYNIANKFVKMIIPRFQVLDNLIQKN